MTPVFYSPAYVGAGHAFDTTRKSKWVADSLAERPIHGLELREPEPLTRAQLCKVHDPAYVAAVETGSPRSLAEAQGFEWDAGLWEMACASNGGAVAAALLALADGGVAGSLSSGLHHARAGQGAGFCTFNGLALAARAALAAGAKAILILDLDAHCGGGTHSLVRSDGRIWQRDVSVSPYDGYEASERTVLELVTAAAAYLPAVERHLNALDEIGVRFDLCLYNAGMDPCEECEVGGLAGLTRDVLAERERLVFEALRRRAIPTAFVLAGGYVGGLLTRAGLVDLHRLTLEAAARSSAN